MNSHSGLTLATLLPHHGRYRAGKTALDFEGQTWSFAGLNEAANRLANALLSAGLKKGDRFATVLPNSAELMTAFWAAAVAGIVIVPCSMLLQRSGLKTLLEDAGVRLVIANPAQAEQIDTISKSLPALQAECCIVLPEGEDTGPAHWTTYTDFIAPHSGALPEVTIAPDDVFNIMYSSGTTGLPKGIIHTHQIRSLYCTLFANAWRMTPESVVLHAGAIVFNGAMLDLLPWMLLGCRYILHRNFDAEAVISDIEQHKVTHLVMVPAQIIAILQSPSYLPQRLASVEMLHNVGAPLHLHYKDRINAELPDRYYELYGVTEGFMTILDKTESQTKTGSVGKPAAFNQVAIMSASGALCDTRVIGEICGKGPLVMPGYHNRPDLTAAAFHGDWLRSGDLGYLDEDGYVFLVDRAKDMIISGGVNVYPRDIEEVVISHPDVTEVAVFGIEHDKWGEVPVAAVTVSCEVLPDSLLRWVNDRVDAKFQRLQCVHILADFPRNVAGKILKRTLREQFSVAAD